MGIDDNIVLAPSGNGPIVVAPDVENEDPKRAAFEEEHRENAYADRNTRAEIEQTFAGERDAIDSRYREDLVKAENRRDKAHGKNRDKQQRAYEKQGLNPNGSDPRGREQTVL